MPTRAAAALAVRRGAGRDRRDADGRLRARARDHRRLREAARAVRRADRLLPRRCSTAAPTPGSISRRCAGPPGARPGSSRTARTSHREALVAKFWAAEGGSRIATATQHLHGGMGVDLDYPIHRYFLWSKQLELQQGGAAPQLVAARPRAGPHPAAGAAMTTRSPSLASIQPGDALPELRVPLTASLIVAGASPRATSRRVHHDKAAAQATGHAGRVHEHPHHRTGWVARFVTDWAGPDARDPKLSIKLGAPNLPGDTMVMSGKVKSKRGRERGGRGGGQERLGQPRHRRRSC